MEKIDTKILLKCECTICQLPIEILELVFKGNDILKLPLLNTYFRTVSKYVIPSICIYRHNLPTLNYILKYFTTINYIKIRPRHLLEYNRINNSIKKKRKMNENKKFKISYLVIDTLNVPAIRYQNKTWTSSKTVPQQCSRHIILYWGNFR